MSEYKDKKIDTNKITITRARELLGNTTMPDIELEKVLENLRAYCGIVYCTHQKIKEQTKENTGNDLHNPAKEADKSNENKPLHTIKDAA